MAKDRKTVYEDDDGRRIADMSEVTRPNLWSFRFPSSAPWHKREREAQAAQNDGEAEAPKQENAQQFSKEDRRAYVLAALGGALAIGAVFAVVFAIAILLIGHFHF